MCKGFDRRPTRRLRSILLRELREGGENGSSLWGIGIMVSFWRRLGYGWVSTLFPVDCPLCGSAVEEHARAVCARCLQKIPYLRSPVCRRCGREFPGSSGADHLCGACLHNPPVFAQARAGVRYEEPVSRLLHRLKYTADTSTMPALKQILEPFSRMLNHDFLPQSDRVIPVPLFPARLKSRGLNQSLLLARILFPAAGDAVLVDVLRRSRDTVPQTTLDGVARRKNLHAAFVVHQEWQLLGRRIFLVDDVFTTGTTVAECSKVLLAAGAAEVLVVTVARVGEYR